MKPSKWKIDVLKKQDIEGMRGLCSDYGFSEYRHYGIGSKEALREYLFKQVVYGWEQGAKILVAKTSSAIVGMVSLARLPWETQYFGYNAAEIKHLIAQGRYVDAIEIKKALLAAADDLAAQEKIKSIDAKSDAEDFSGIHALGDCCFRFMGTQMTYTINLNTYRMPEFKDLCTVRTLRKSDVPQLIKLAQLYSPKSRFNIEVNPTVNRANMSYYVAWVKNACRGGFADGVYVAQRHKRIVGFFTYRLNQDLKKFLGVTSLHQGLLIVSPEGKGSALSLLKTVGLEAKTALHADLVELDTYLHNYPMTAVLQKIGAKLSKVRYLFQKT